MWCKCWITSRSKFTSCSKLKCKYGSFNPCKEWWKFINFTSRFTAFTTFLDKSGDYLGENKWPSDDRNLENSIEIYAENSARIAQNVLQLLAEGLGAKGQLISK